MGVLSWPNQNFPPRILKNEFTADEPPLSTERFGPEICETSVPRNSAITMLVIIHLSVVKQQVITTTRKKVSLTRLYRDLKLISSLVSMEWGEEWNGVTFPTRCQCPSKGLPKSACLKQMRTAGQTPTETPTVSVIYTFTRKPRFRQLFPQQVSKQYFFCCWTWLLYLEIPATMSELCNAGVKQ